MMSIGTDKGSWWADPSFGSELWLLKEEGKIDSQTAGTLERMVRESLQWLVNDGIAATVDCKAERAGKNRIDYQATVMRPDGTLILIKDVWYVL